MFPALIEKLRRQEDLTTTEAAEAMASIMRGEAAPAQIAGLLVGLGMKGRAARPSWSASRRRCARTRCRSRATPGAVFDTCGTGGDRSGTFNISTASAIVLAACGMRVAKHGNRSVSSQCGSADVLEALGVNIQATADTAARVPERSRHRVPVRADVSSGDEARRTGAQGSRRAHGVQPARTAHQSGAAGATDRRRAAARADRAARAFAVAARLRARVGGARRRRSRRALDDRLHEGVGVQGHLGADVLRASRRLRFGEGHARIVEGRRCGDQREDRHARC